MSYDANFDDAAKSGGQVASGAGWVEFCQWVAALQGPWQELRHLCEYGWSGQLPELVNEIRAASHDAAGQSVASIAANLIKMIDKAIVGGAENLVISQ